MFKNLYLWLLIAAVLLLTVQILALIIYIYSFVPLVWDESFLKGIEPNRDVLFYFIFLVTSVLLMAVAVKWALPWLDSTGNRRRLNLWLGLEFIWCFLMVFCFFKWTTYRYPFWNVLIFENSSWLQPFFCAVCVLAALSKVFFPEIEKFYKYLRTHMGQESFFNPYVLPFQAIFIGAVVLLLYIPKPEDVTALALVWDGWNHLDRVAGWFIKHGWCISYEETVQILVMMAITYTIGLFYFIRLWLKSWLLAAIGALMAVKMGMFYYGISPCIWMTPANSFLAHGWDIFFFFGLWWVSVKYPKKFCAVAALMGVFLVVCWVKSNGYLRALGLENQPMMAPLRVRQFFPYFMGYFVPLFYVFSLLVLVGQSNVQKTQKLGLPIVLCIYGLMIFTDYIERPMIGLYGALIVPAILVVLWWFKQIFSSFGLFFQRGLYFGIFLLVLGALLTNRLMLTYPNFIFQDQQRFSSERKNYQQWDTLAQTASLIRQLTREDQRVALISNFETALLMQADRQPLFKDFPVMFSSYSNPGGLDLITKKQGLDLIDSLTQENALYVFVDARLWALPPQALGNGGLNAVFGFLRNHYQEYTRRGFLVALQRR